MNFKDKTLKTNNGILSTTRPEYLLQVTKKLKIQNKDTTINKFKQIIQVFVDPISGKKYVAAATAYSLGITKVRAIMLEKPKLYEITMDIIEEFKRQNNNIDYEIQFCSLPNINKQKIKLYYTENEDCYIEISAAYALGYIEVQEFSQSANPYYGPLNKSQLDFIKNSYEIESYSIDNFEQHNKKK